MANDPTHEWLTEGAVETIYGFGHSVQARWLKDCLPLGKGIETQPCGRGRLRSKKDFDAIQELIDNPPGKTFPDEEGEWGNGSVIATAPYGFRVEAALALNDGSAPGPLPFDPNDPDKRPRVQWRFIYGKGRGGFRPVPYFHLGDYGSYRDKLEAGAVEWDGLCKYALKFKGKRVTVEFLPDWARAQLPPPGTAKRLCDPKHENDTGLTVCEAIDQGHCKTWWELFGWSRKGKSLPGLEGETLKAWDEYQVEKSGTILRFTVFSGKQLGRSQETVTALADKRRLSEWRTDADLMKQYPKLLGAERTPRVKRKTSGGRTLSRPRPTILTAWRHKDPAFSRIGKDGLIENNPRRLRN